MQSSKFLSLIATAAITIVVPAHAADNDFRTGTYAGIGLGVSSMDVNSSPSTVSKVDDHGALKMYGGYRFTENFGAEAGYVRTGRIKVTESINDIDVTRSVKTRAAYLVGTGRLPITSNFSILARLGMAYGDVNVGDVAPIPNTVDGSKISIMFGASAQYRLSDRYSLSLDYDHVSKESKLVSANALTMTVSRSF